MSKKKQSKGKMSIIEWCDYMVSQGHELTLKWEGGGDSGWVYFEVDGEQLENEYTEALVDYCYDTLDYGSWAGEFSASGEAPYDTNEKAFTGVDYYSEEDTNDEDPKILLRVPKDIWFDGISIDIEDVENFVHDGAIEVELLIQNGIVTEDHSKTAVTIQENIKQGIEKMLGDEDSAIFANHTYRAEDFEEDPETGDKILWMNPVSVRTTEMEDKDITIDVNDVVLKSTDEK